jgi:hypothetical protein
MKVVKVQKIVIKIIAVTEMAEISDGGIMMMVRAMRL